MKGFGIALIVIQAMAIFGSIVSSEYLDMYLRLASVRGFGNFIGFHILGVVGIILLVKGIKKDKKKELENNELN